MNPSDLSKLLKNMASYIEEDDKPSLTLITSSLKSSIRALEAQDQFTRVALFKETWRKVVNTKGERKLLSKLDKMKKVMDTIPKVQSMLKKGEDLSDIVKDEVRAGVLFMALERSSGASKEMMATAPDDADGMIGFADHMDEWWADDGEDEEESDRDALLEAFKKLGHDTASRMKELKGKLEKKK